MKPPPWIKPNKTPNNRPGYVATIIAVDRVKGIITIEGPVNILVGSEVLKFDPGTRIFIPFMDPNA